MALSQTARGPVWARTALLGSNIGELVAAVAWSGFLALAIAGPWLSVSGYLFGTDWPGPRHFHLTPTISASIPAEAFFTAASLISAELAGKLLVVAILFAAAFFAYRAVPAGTFGPRGAGAAIYVFNPFVFGRLHYGQLFLLAGYALLPWVAIRLRDLCREPTWLAGLILAISVSLVAVFTLHLVFVSAVLTAVVVPVYLVGAKQRVEYAKRLIPALAVAAGATFLLSSYWAVPLVMGRSSEAAVIGGTSPGLLSAYAAVPDQSVGLVPNLLGLYGFWAENSRRFTSMKAFVPEWPVVLFVLLVICGVGVVAAFRRKDRNLAPWTAGLVLAAMIGLILEMGISHPLTSGFVHWLDTNVPIYRGMRDAGKWAALLALVYSQLFGLGAAAILDWIRKVRLPTPQVEWVGAVMVGLLLALPVYYGNGLLFGMHGEIKPSEYPAGWYAADRMLLADPHPGRTLFLPWHEYMSFGFIQNQNRVVASPAVTFFSVPIVSSANPEIGGSPPAEPEQIAITQLVGAGATGDWSHQLAQMGIKYVLVAREVDWQGYAYFASQPGLDLVRDYGSIVLYRNTLVT